MHTARRHAVMLRLDDHRHAAWFEHLLEAVRTAARGEYYLDPESAAALESAEGEPVVIAAGGSSQ